MDSFRFRFFLNDTVLWNRQFDCCIMPTKKVRPVFRKVNAFYLHILCVKRQYNNVSSKHTSSFHKEEVSIVAQ